MKNLLTCSLAVCFVLCSCVGQSAKPPQKFTKFEGATITGVEIGSGFEVTIEQGAVAKAEFEVSGDWVDRLQVELDPDGTLDVSVDKSAILSRDPVLKLRLVCPTLRELDLSGAASVNVSSAFASDKLKIDASGASNVSFAHPITVSGNVEIDASGASVVQVMGSAAYVEVEASGASKINSSGLQSARAACEASGASSVELFASESVSGQASGASSVRVSGGGAIRFNSVSGASSVSAK